jgi:phosphoglycerate dehydrogenase-like enzyme
MPKMKTEVVILACLPDGVLEQLQGRFPQCEFLDGRNPAALKAHLASAVITYGHPPADQLPQASSLRWIQLISAGVPQDLCPPALRQKITVTNLAGLYGPTIAEHALGLMIVLARKLQVAQRNQSRAAWDRSLASSMIDLRRRTLAIIGLGNIGQSVARLAHGHGMRVVGCRRTKRPAPFVDRVFPLAELHAMLAEADVLCVAAPLTKQTDGMLGPAEFAAMKRGALYINISRGGIAQEPALLDALKSGQVAGAGLDVFAVEPLRPDHPLWGMPQVVITPHYSGETVNLAQPPSERFARNLAAWLVGRQLEGVVDLECGY